MEFWAVKVESEQTVDVVLGEGQVLHLCQASFAEIKKGVKDNVCLQIIVDGKTITLGTFHPERNPQQVFDLLFDKSFKITHNYTDSSVFFYGYKDDDPNDDEPFKDHYPDDDEPFKDHYPMNEDQSEYFDYEDEEEELPLTVVDEKQDAKTQDKAAGKQKETPKKHLSGKKGPNESASKAHKRAKKRRLNVKKVELKETPK